MKIKYSIIYIAVAVAFAAVAAWVFISGGHNAKAVRAKFRLGGVLLSISSILGLTGCKAGAPMVTCYDVPATNDIVFTCPDPETNVVSPGDSIKISMNYAEHPGYRYSLTSAADGVELQKDTLVFDEGHNASLVVGKTDFKGKATLQLLSVYEGNEFGIAECVVDIK